ncbi:uncharacterized protein LOC119349934 [Triticum dicoccoides]|uniref:uncharacterized protein LOC119349934 n=1 Tax=Triticum dicoccoides TaxID=85692 RepID=UPI0018904467|nr:uncharacterized protein LOC119349934 [Triticum dicoccoides]
MVISRLSSLHTDQGSVKNRSSVFSEAVMIMVCPVLLAILQDNVQLKWTSAAVAGAALLAGVVQFVVICLLMTVNYWVPVTVNNWVFGVSKMLIHLCIVLVMILAAIIMTLIVLKSLLGYLAALFILGVFSFVVLLVSLRRRDGQGNMNTEEFEQFKGPLEASANFSAAVTAVLFLGLEALALEDVVKGKDLVKGNLMGQLAFPLGLSFATCAIGVFSMLLVSVHPLIHDHKTNVPYLVHGLSITLGVSVCIVVYSITEAAVGQHKTIQWLSPSVVPPFISLFLACFETYRTNEKHEPASLELTKITFAAFLAVSVISRADTSVGDCSAFLCFTALGIMTGVQWRLMTHWKNVPVAVARAADVACFMSHLSMACAVIPFSLLAAAVVKKTEANCPAAAPLPSH